MVTTGVLEPFTNETLVPTKLAVMTGHQAKSAERTMQTLQGILRVKDFERVLKRVATTAINRRVDLNVPPGKHQQCGLELINGVQQNPLDIQDRQGCQIKDALGQPWKTFVQVVGQIDRTDRKDRIARQADQQHPLLSVETRVLQQRPWTLTSVLREALGQSPRHFVKQWLHRAMLLYTCAQAGLSCPSLNRSFGNISFRSHDHHPPAALRRF